MTITAGTPIAVDAMAQSGSTSVTIPSGTTCVVAFWHYYDGDSAAMSSLSLGGSGLTLPTNIGIGGGGEPGGGVGYIHTTSSGSLTFAWTWGGSGGDRDEGGRIYLWPFSSNTGVVRYLDSDFTATLAVVDLPTLVLTSVTGGWVGGCCQSYTPTNPDIAVTGQTAVVNNQAYNSEIYDLGYVNTVGASTTNMDMTSQNYSGLAAVSLYEDVAPPSSAKLLSMINNQGGF